jgi:hypothetical protein
MTPNLIVHCDWSISARKRWRAAAYRLTERAFAVDLPTPAGRIDTFFSELQERGRTGPILAGFDFPIGVPRRYAGRAGITRFREELLRFGEGRWANFYRRAESADQISLTRPFYPKAPGGKVQQHLIDGLGLQPVRLRLSPESPDNRLLERVAARRMDVDVLGSQVRDPGGLSGILKRRCLCTTRGWQFSQSVSALASSPLPNRPLERAPGPI